MKALDACLWVWRHILKLTIWFCLTLLIAESIPWALITVQRATKAQIVPDDERAKASISRIADSISLLQNIGNRTTMAKQQEAAEWIAARFRSQHVASAIQTIDEGNRQWPVVVARSPGKKRDNESILLLAHLDSTADNTDFMAPGADDNAGGVAVLLDVAQQLAFLSHDRSILFCVFSDEEGRLSGSKGFARKARLEAMNIRAVINVDVVGYNQPSKPVVFGAIFCHDTIKQRLKAVWRMQANYFGGLIYGTDCVKVAGRTEDEYWVRTVASGLQRSGSLRAEGIVDPHCG